MASDAKNYLFESQNHKIGIEYGTLRNKSTPTCQSGWRDLEFLRYRSVVDDVARAMVWSKGKDLVWASNPAESDI